MQAKLPILYSFRRCPYAIRARLALAVSEQACVHREVDLKQRPPELYAASPKGTVPVLVFGDGVVLEESLEIMHWTLGNHDPSCWLPSSEEQRAQTAALIAACDGDFKHNLDRYKYASRHPGSQAEDHRELASEFLRELERHLAGGPYLLGSACSLADMAIAPFVRQFAFTDREWFDSRAWPHLREWLERFLASELFTGVMVKHPVWCHE